MKEKLDEWEKEAEREEPGYFIHHNEMTRERILTLIAIVKKQNEALEFYGDDKTWNYPSNPDSYYPLIRTDADSPAHIPGNKARAVIEDCKGMLNE